MLTIRSVSAPGFQCRARPQGPETIAMSGRCVSVLNFVLPRFRLNILKILKICTKPILPSTYSGFYQHKSTYLGICSDFFPCRWRILQVPAFSKTAQCYRSFPSFYPPKVIKKMKKSKICLVIGKIIRVFVVEQGPSDLTTF